MAAKTVDVLIPCYNYGRFLRTCVQSVLSQPDVEVRVLIIDDASGDSTPTIGAQLAAEDSRVRFVRHSVNAGHIATYNEGIETWESEYALLLSADDVLTPGALRRATHLMEKYPKIGFVYGPAIPCYEGTALPPFPNPASGEKIQVVAGEQFIKNVCTSTHNPVWTPTAVVRTSLQRKLGGYRKDLPHSGDLEMWLRFAAYGDIGVLDTYQAYYRTHANNMNRSYAGVKDFDQRKAAFDGFFRMHGDQLQDCSSLENLTATQLSQSAFWSAHKAWRQQQRKECQDLLDFSVANWPGIRTTNQWSRFEWKRRLGHTALLVEPWIDRLRGRSANAGL